MLQTPGREYQTGVLLCLTACYIDSASLLDYIKDKIKPKACAVFHALEAFGNLAPVVSSKFVRNIFYALLNDEIDRAADVGRLVIAIKSQILCCREFSRTGLQIIIWVTNDKELKL